MTYQKPIKTVVVFYTERLMSLLAYLLTEIPNDEISNVGYVNTIINKNVMYFNSFQTMYTIKPRNTANFHVPQNCI